MKRILFVMVMVLSVALTACGGAPAPVALSSLPVLTGATESTNEMLVAMLGTVTEAAKADSTVKNSEAKAYDVPQGTTFDAIASFYKTVLEKDGWTAVASSAPNLVYGRGKQALNVTHAEALGGLVVVLTELK